MFFKKKGFPINIVKPVEMNVKVDANSKIEAACTDNVVMALAVVMIGSAVIAFNGAYSAVEKAKYKYNACKTTDTGKETE